jgi:hypothetical protein
MWETNEDLPRKSLRNCRCDNLRDNIQTALRGVIVALGDLCLAVVLVDNDRDEAALPPEVN